MLLGSFKKAVSQTIRQLIDFKTVLFYDQHVSQAQREVNKYIVKLFYLNIELAQNVIVGASRIKRTKRKRPSSVNLVSNQKGKFFNYLHIGV